MLKKFAVLFFALLALLPLTASNAFGATRLLTTLKIGPALATHAIPVRGCAEGLTHVRLDVEGSSIFVERFGVKMQDGRVLSMPDNKSYPVGAGQWTDISPSRRFGCVVQVFAIARSETARAAKVLAYGNYP